MHVQPARLIRCKPGEAATCCERTAQKPMTGKKGPRSCEIPNSTAQRRGVLPFTRLLRAARRPRVTQLTIASDNQPRTIIADAPERQAIAMPSWTSGFLASGVAEFVYRIRNAERDEFRGGHTGMAHRLEAERRDEMDGPSVN